MEEKIFHILIQELCEELNIKFERLSFDWILQLSKGNIVRHITGNKFDLNPEAAGNVACDKYATYEVLRSRNIPVAKHIMIFNPANRSRYIENNGNGVTIANEFLKYGTLVVKPNSGSEGLGVSLCHSIKEVEVAIQKLFRTQSSISICPYYDIRMEYRTFYLDGEVLLVYGKTKPYVIGDGKSSLMELVEALNLPDKQVARDNVKELDLSYIPADGEKVDLSWKHNLSGGAKPTIIENGELCDKIVELAIKAGKAMNVRFATIDVIETMDDDLMVLEVNSGVCASIFVNSVENGYDIAKNIYRLALKKMFEAQ